MPTGTGKTVVFSHVIDQMHAKTGKRAIVIAHREELIDQAADKILQVTGRACDVEMGDRKADQNSFWKSQTVVASVQTLSQAKRIAKFNPAEFGLLVIDEAHHATADSYVKVIEHFKGAKLFGVTATPDRSDNTALGKVFSKAAYVYDIEHAIHDGYLVPIHQRMVTVNELDFSQIRTQGGDLHGGELAAVMEREANVHKVTVPLMREAGFRKTLVFAASVHHGEMMTEILNRTNPGSAMMITGMTDKLVRAQVLRRYDDNEFQFLVNVGVFTEGFDDPGIEMVAIARPTKSRSLYCQMIGRGTRPLPGLVDGIDYPSERKQRIAASNKPRIIVLDFVGNSGKHKLVTTADILGGNYDDDEKARAVKNVKAGKGTDMALALDNARREIKAEKAKRLEEERKAEAERQRRKAIRAQAKYQSVDVDPFDIGNVQADRLHDKFAGREASDKQKAFLAKAGVPNTETMDFATAMRLTGEIMHRRQTGGCTFKQAHILKKYGYPTNVSFDKAKLTIDAIAANGWKRPRTPIGVSA